MFDANYVTKDFKQVWGDPTPAQIAGNRIHKAFEDALLIGADLPPEYAEQKFIQETFNRVKGISKKLKGKVQPEKDMAVRSDFSPTDFWAKDALFRGKLDVFIKAKAGDIGYLGDFKNGTSKWSTPDQLDRCALLMFSENLMLKKVIAEYHYLMEGKRFKYVYYRSKKLQDEDKKTESKTQDQLQSKLTYDINLVRSCYEKGLFIPKRNGLCKRHCPVADCEYNGR